jgi:hypothetical protein
MNARDLLDQTREAFVNANTSPSRAIVYKRKSDSTEIPLNSFVSSGQFNQDEADDKKVNSITCAGLILEEEPTPQDTITSDGKIYNVRQWSKSGNTYMVEATTKRNKVSSRSFK